MSKLSQPLKDLINAAWARPNATRAPPGIRKVYTRIAENAASKNVGVPAWLTMSTAATVTMNSPASMVELLHVANEADSKRTPVENAELIREAGLKCITLNGVARTIISLGGFYEGLPEDISSAMSTQPTRKLEQHSTSDIFNVGKEAWKSFYQPFDSKLAAKLGVFHPDMPEYIIGGHYGMLLGPTGGKVGRALSSIVAIAALRAQTGVGPQLTSHVFGLRKSYDDGTADAEPEVVGGKWLASNEGSIWMLNCVDEITGAIGEGAGSNFAPGTKSKL